jgi:hypothetical protein
MGKRYAALGLFFIFLIREVPAQTSSTETLPSVQFDTSDFPLWAKDLRRAEIVAFGSFPFTMFFATFLMDTVRFADHGGKIEYAPWPFKSAGAIDMNRTERSQTIIAAAAASVAVSLIDYIIVKYRKAKAEKAGPPAPAEPAIIRRAWPEPAAGKNRDASPESSPGESPDAPPGAGEGPDASPEPGEGG